MPEHGDKTKCLSCGADAIVLHNKDYKWTVYCPICQATGEAQGDPPTLKITVITKPEPIQWQTKYEDTYS